MDTLISMGIGKQADFYHDAHQHLAAESPSPFVLVCLDAGNLDEALGLFGPSCRDRMLESMADSILDAVGDGGRVYHIGHDRFAIITDKTSAENCLNVVRSAIDRLSQPITVEGVPFMVTPRAGIARCPAHAETVEDLVRASVTAVQFARTKNQSYAFFDVELDAQRRRDFMMVAELSNVLASDTACLETWLQPLVCTKTGGCIGAEALLRWRHPEHGIVSAGRFVPLLECTSLFRPLTETVLSSCFEMTARWRKTRSDLKLSINLSPRDLDDPDFCRRIEDISGYHGASLTGIEFEITETALTNNERAAFHTLSELKARGATLTLDDYGAGYANLQFLLSMPFDRIKLDISLIHGAMTNKTYDRTVKSTVDLAHRIGMTVTAEGVETEKHEDAARKWGCDCLQGYHFARPMPETDFMDWKRRHDARNDPAPNGVVDLTSRRSS